MANTTSAKKAIRQTKKRTTANRAWKRRLKRSLRQVDDLLASQSPPADQIKDAQSQLAKITDKAARRRIIHPNRASRLKKKVALRIKSVIKTK